VTTDAEPGSGDRGDEASRRAYVESGLSVLGLEAGPDELAVITAVHAIYGPALDALMAEGFDGVADEPGADMSRPPHTAAGR
jgi:hypothetical protein